MSAGHYHRRWSANTAGRTTPTSQTLASSIEPSTYGTSWNSVRWNKPSTAGYRSQASTIAARFEPKTYYSVSPSARSSTVSSRYSNGTGNDAARTAAQVASLGPSVSARASRFDTSVRDGGSKYRNEARELLNKWTSRERNNADNSSTSKPMENAAASGYLNKTNEYPYRKTASVTPSRTTVPAISRFSADRTSALSASPLPQVHTPRAERPWRQRLAESSRIRASLGDDYRSRNGSTDSSRSQNYGSRTRTSTSYTPSFALSYGRTKPEEPKELMSRSYSPVRSRNETFRSLTTSEQPRSLLKPSVLDGKSDRNSSQESLRDPDKQSMSHAGVSSVPKNPSIRESSQERDPEKHKLRSSKERTARRNSRQRALTHSSSSDEEIDRSLTRADAKRRRRRHRESAEQAPLPPPTVAANGMLKSLDSSLNKTGSADDSKSTPTRQHPPAAPKDLKASASPTLTVPSGPVWRGSLLPSSPAYASRPMIVVPVLASPSVSPSPVSVSLSAPTEFTASPSPPPSGANRDTSRTTMKHLSPPKFFKINNVIRSYDKKPVAGNVSTSEDLSLATKSDATLKNSRPNSMVEPPTKEIKSPVAAPPPKSNDCGSLDGFTDSEESATDASSIIDDESQYSAVVHFKPCKPKVKRVAPVPGLWKVEGADEFISKNKRLVRETLQAAVTHVWKVRPHETATKRIRPLKTLNVMKPEPKKQMAPVEDKDKKEVKKFSGLTKDEKVEEKPKKIMEESKKENKKLEAPVVRIEKKTPPAPKKDEKVAVAEPKGKKDEKIAVMEPKEKKDDKTAVAEPKDKKNEKITVVQPKEKKDEKIAVAGPKEKKEEKASVPEVQQKKEVELKGLKVLSKAAVPKEEKIQISAILRSQAPRIDGVTVILVQPIFVSYKHPQKIREIKPLVTKSVSHSLFKKSLQLDSQKTITQKKKSRASASLSCKAASIEQATCTKELRRKSMQFGAHVTVDRPVPDVNISRVRLKIRRAKQPLPPAPVEPAPPVENGTPRRSTSVDSESSYLQTVRRVIEASPMSTSQTRAAEVLDDMRGTEPAHVIRRPSRQEEYNAAGHLILPDKSLLEEYVKRKRGRLEQQLKEPIPERDEPRCVSPTNSVASELIPAAAVRVFERSPYGVPVITAPSRSVSRVSSVSSGPEPITPTVMLDTLSAYNNFNSTPQGFLRHDVTPRIQIAKPIPFDPPKTPFEERLQQQAHAIRKASASSIFPTDERLPENRPRRFSNPSDGMSALTTSFTNAVAANANNARHERYAAHIPVNRGDSGSGRQSTISQDSQQSGALENATKQLDHVIDQARHKHSQHRNKFKEAIDYLDQIFEDLKKECDTNVEDNKERVPATAAVPTTTSSKVSTAAASSQKDSIRRPTVIHPTASKPSTSAPKRSVRQVKPVQPPSPVEVVLPQPPVVADSESAEVDVTETIVLPKKTDKLDFTRRWLQDDLSSLALQPPAPVMFFPEACSYYNDADEHSLGSCSAEVAAINSPARKEKPKRSNGIAIVASLEKPAPIRPQPCRPQPVYPTQDRTTGPRHFPVELEVPNIPRVASYDHVSERQHPSNSWRSGSQEPYQAQGSVPPEDIMRPSPSAFQSVSSFSGRGGNMRGSLRSLPDAGLIIRGKYQQQASPMKDPSLAIDQLCAELELNTEQPLTAADKRRSFPTSYGHDSSYATGSMLYEQPTRRQSERRAPLIEKKAQPYQQPPPVAVYHTAVSSHQPIHQSHSTPMNNQHRVTHAAAQHPPQQPQPAVQVQRMPQAPTYSTHPVVKKTPPQQGRQQKSLDEVTNMLNKVVNDFHANQQPPRKKSQPSHAMYATPHSMNQSNPFETINQEKINPSRVEAMHNMFERNAAPAQSRWNVQPPYHLANRPREDDAYHEIEYHSNRPPPVKATAIPPPPSSAAPPQPVLPPYIGPHASPPRHNAIGIRNNSPQNYVTEYTPAYPTTQPPSHPPGRNGSATSSQNGGYYSSNSSGVGGPAYQHNNQISTRRGSIVGHQSASSRAASIADDDEDDGFYDNIGTYDDRRVSRSSEMDVASLSSHQLPPTGWKPTKIGSFLRKIGAGNRPPGSAASLVSLNKVANETPIKQGNLMKSNSLSNEPWKKMVIENPSIPTREPTPSKGGLGARLKNSIFGSKKRLNG